MSAPRVRPTSRALRALEYVDEDTLAAEFRKPSYVDCYRVDTRIFARRMRAVRVSRQRLMTARQAARYLRQVHAIDVNPKKLRELARQGDIDCHVFTSKPAERRRYEQTLRRAPLRFTHHDIEHSTFLMLELRYRKAGITRTDLRAAVMRSREKRDRRNA